mgnify:CR=1 FL=1
MITVKQHDNTSTTDKINVGQQWDELERREMLSLLSRSK